LKFSLWVFRILKESIFTLEISFLNNFGASWLLTYLAPEVSSGKPYTEVADIYAVGIIYWEIVTRERYFGHLTFPSDIHKRYGVERVKRGRGRKRKKEGRDRGMGDEEKGGKGG
jgi:hypothetical protein